MKITKNPNQSLLMPCPPLKQKGSIPEESDLTPEVRAILGTHVIDLVRSEDAWPVRAHIVLTIDNNRL